MATKHQQMWASIDADFATLRAEVERLRAAYVPAGWQRRLKYAENGAAPQWEQCGVNEATDRFIRSPHHEYREIFARAALAQEKQDDR